MARDRDTYVHRHGVTPETMSVISTKNKLYAVPADSGATEAFQIGVIATFDPSETRGIETVRGIGFGDHVAELVPGLTEPMTITVTRTAQYLSMIFQVFGYKGGIDGLVRSLRHHKWPFDVRQEQVISSIEQVTSSTSNRSGSRYGGIVRSSDEFDEDSLNGEPLDAIVTLYEGCWMSDYSVSYSSDTALVQENVTLNVTDVVSSNVDYTESSDFFNTEAISSIMRNPGPGVDPLGEGGVAVGRQ